MRLTAIDAVDPSDRVRITELAMRYRDMIEALGGIVLFRNTIAALDPMFEGEREILDALLSIAERDGDETARMSISVESTERVIKTLSSATSHPKIVAFSSSTEAAVRFHALLAERSDEVDWLLSPVRPADRGGDQVSRFQASRRAAVLVLDRGGEEGLNLNFADHRPSRSSVFRGTDGAAYRPIGSIRTPPFLDQAPHPGPVRRRRWSLVGMAGRSGGRSPNFPSIHQ